MKHLFLTGLAALTLTACGNADTHTALETKGGIEISNAEFRPPMPGRDISAAYFTVTNHGDADRLLAVTSPVSDKVELHNHIHEDGVMKMRRVDGVDLPAGQDVVFKPGGLHVMLFEVTLPEGTEDMALTFDFETAPDVTVIADKLAKPAHKGHKKDDHKGH